MQKSCLVSHTGITLTVVTGPVVHSVVSSTADPGSRVQSLPGPILLWRLTMKYHLRTFSSTPDSRRVVVSYKYVLELLVSRGVNLAQEKCGKVN